MKYSLTSDKKVLIVEDEAGNQQAFVPEMLVRQNIADEKQKAQNAKQFDDRIARRIELLEKIKELQKK